MKDLNIGHRFLRIGSFIFTGFFIALFIELFYEACLASTGISTDGVLNSSFTTGFILRFGVLFAASLAIITICYAFHKRLGALLFKWRFLIGVLLVLLAVLFEASGSSLASLNNSFGIATDRSNTLGIPRAIRSDEYSVFLSFLLSQEHNAYAAVSDIIRASSTDVTMIYGQPSWALVTFFRPFLWGFLVLGSAKGLAFFWAARFVVLFLVSFEFARKYTEDNRLLSLLAAVLIACAPLVQWWFAINGLVEMLIFGQLACILIEKYCKTKSLPLRACILLGVIYCGEAFLFVLYPAWQVPVFYVFLAFLAWIIWKNWGTVGLRKQDIGLLVLSFFLFGALTVTILMQSWDALHSIMNTAYPGARLETGGNSALNTLGWMTSLFLPFSTPSIVNQSELSSIMSLFPLGLLLAFVTLLFKRDKLTITLSIATVFLFVYCAIGFPEFLAKASLLNNSVGYRCVLGVALLSVFLLIRSLWVLLSIQRIESSNKSRALVFLALFAFLVVCFVGILNGVYLYDRSFYLAICIIFLVVCALLIAGGFFFASFSEFVLFLASTVFVLGMMVNPIQFGLNGYDDNQILLSAEEVASNDPEAKWIVEGTRSPVNNALIAKGIPTINCVNVYPDLNRWHLLDPEKESEHIYNRYAQILVDIDNKETTFELLAPDAFSVSLNPADLDMLEARYILTTRTLSDLDDSFVLLREINTEDSWKIYEYLPST